ncbi:putative quinol monooxygenase [Streptomyces sp. NPDC056656]|uniref:putative quinol monooxygenase n=1 Tax=Streptomyces sp. NPDC056656 TaxID=3345895 RepID=UPI0036CF9B86
MIIVAGSAVFDVDHLDEVRAENRKIEEITRAEDGCLYYAMAFDDPDKGEVTVLEQWRDNASLDAHLLTESLKQFQARVIGHARDFSIKRYEVGAGQEVGTPEG